MCFFVMKYRKLELPYLYLTATYNKEFTGKSSLTSFCAESREKKLGWSTIFHERKSVVKAKIAQNDWQVSEGVKPDQTRSRFHSWIDYLKTEPVCRFCNLQPVCFILTINGFVTVSSWEKLHWVTRQYQKTDQDFVL